MHAPCPCSIMRLLGRVRARCSAGIQRRVALAGEEEDDWAARQLELDINCSGPVHLTHLLTPHLLKQREAAIVNITSSLGFIPCAFGPAYGATKVLCLPLAPAVPRQTGQMQIGAVPGCVAAWDVPGADSSWRRPLAQLRCLVGHGHSCHSHVCCCRQLAPVLMPCAGLHALLDSGSTAALRKHPHPHL